MNLLKMSGYVSQVILVLAIFWSFAFSGKADKVFFNNVNQLMVSSGVCFSSFVGLRVLGRRIFLDGFSGRPCPLLIAHIELLPRLNIILTASSWILVRSSPELSKELLPRHGLPFPIALVWLGTARSLAREENTLTTRLSRRCLTAKHIYCNREIKRSQAYF